MKIPIWFAVVFLMLSSCRIVDRLEKDRVMLGLVNSKQYDEIAATQSVPEISAEITKNQPEATKQPFYTIAHLDEKGDPLVEVALKGVSVYARQQVVPERSGKVQVNFKVLIPASLQNKDWQLTMQPYLHLNGEQKALEPLHILGSFASLLQQRDYWRYEKLRARMLREADGNELTPQQELKLQKLFNKMVVHQKNTGARLNSVVKKGANFVYDYVQDVPTKGIMGGESIRVTLEGTVKAIDRSEYRVPVKDTLQYNIASMLSFIDSTPRFILNVVHKHVTVNTKHDIFFEQGDYRISESAGNNRVELDSLQALLKQMLVDNEYIIDSLVLTSGSSPEGRFDYNLQLSEKRAKSLRKYICDRFGSEVDSILKVCWKGEDWDALTEMLRTDPAIRNRDKILKGLNEFRKKPDDKEYYLRRYCREDFPYISKELYPKLRLVDLKYSLRRRKMVQDTLYTNEIDSVYMTGLKHLQRREYVEALHYLANYPCVNTAIILLSMDYNKRAFDMLKSLPKSAEVYYLLTVASIRLNKMKEAEKNFEQACLIKSSLRFRQFVDPELMKIKK